MGLGSSGRHRIHTVRHRDQPWKIILQFLPVCPAESRESGRSAESLRGRTCSWTMAFSASTSTAAARCFRRSNGSSWSPPPSRTRRSTSVSISGGLRLAATGSAPRRPDAGRGALDRYMASDELGSHFRVEGRARAPVRADPMISLSGEPGQSPALTLPVDTGCALVPPRGRASSRRSVPAGSPCVVR